MLLFVLGKAEIEAVDSRRDFYESERQVWSMRLATGLAKLGRHLDLNPEIDEGSELDWSDGVIAETEVSVVSCGRTAVRGDEYASSAEGRATAPLPNGPKDDMATPSS